VRAFSAGADDVVPHSIDRAELLARLLAIIRRSCKCSQPSLQVGKISLNPARGEVRVDGQEVYLTGREFEILHALLLRKNIVLSKETLIAHLYNGMDERDAKIIDVFICKTRSKLAKAGAPNVIATVWGHGYTVRDAPRDSQAPVPAQPAQRVQQTRSSALSAA
jgi:two-component system cell cycle response regulator CtrA